MRGKYKIWDKQEKKWFEPTYEAYNNKIEELFLSPSGELVMRKLELGLYRMIHESLFKDRFEVVWSTGIQDKHGKEIYEGDILNVVHMMVENVPPYRAKIEWDKYRFAIVNLEIERLKWNTFVYLMGNLDPFGLSLEIIGNIHDHPHLLEG